MRCEVLSELRNLENLLKEEVSKMDLSEVTVERLPSYMIGFEKGEVVGEKRGEEIGKKIGKEIARKEILKKSILAMQRLGIAKEVIAKELELSMNELEEILQNG